MTRRIWAAVVLLMPSIVRADPVRLETSGTGCDLESLPAAISVTAARDPFTPFARTAIRVDTSATETGLIARMWIETPDTKSGVRTVNAGTCDELIETLSVVIAMALPADTSPVPEPSPVEPEREPQLHVIAPEPRVTSALVGASIGSEADTSLSFGLRSRRARNSFAFEVRPSAVVDIELERMGTVQVRRTDAVAVGCRHHHAFAACGVAGVSLVQATGIDLLRPRSVASALAFAGLRAAWEQNISSRFVLRAHAELDGMLGHIALEVDSMSIWRSPTVEAIGGLALLVHFP